jgi:hypothetical protein
MKKMKNKKTKQKTYLILDYFCTCLIAFVATHIKLMKGKETLKIIYIYKKKHLPCCGLLLWLFGCFCCNTHRMFMKENEKQ